MQQATRRKFTRNYANGKRPHTGEVSKDDPGITGRDYIVRLDPEFNMRYVQACHYERALYNLRNPSVAND